MDEEMVPQETLDTAPGEDTLVPEEVTEDVNVEQDQDEIAKARELANNYKIRAEKAERLLKQKSEAKPAEDVKLQNDVALTPKDYLALTEHKIGSEDFDEVLRLSKLLGKSIAETVKDKTAKIILEQRAEERATSLAAHTGNGRRGTKAETADDILEKFSKGHISEKDDDIEKLVKARIAQKKARLKG